MKRLSCLVFGLVFLGSVAFKPNAADCQPYYPIKEGTVLTLTSFNDKNKETGSVVQTLKSVKSIPGGIEIQASSESFNDKGKSLATSDFLAKCVDGVFYLDMKNFVSGEQMAGFQNMEMKVESESIDIPSNPTVGQELKNGFVNITATSPGSTLNLMKLRVDISNRKVEAIESITTPAGTFNCVKISCDVETATFFKVRAKSVEWVSKEYGTVRSESYNSKGKLTGYSVLSSVKK